MPKKDHVKEKKDPDWMCLEVAETKLSTSTINGKYHRSVTNCEVDVRARNRALLTTKRAKQYIERKIAGDIKKNQIASGFWVH